MEITYAKPLQNLLTLYDHAQNKRDAKAQFQLAEMLLRLKNPSAQKTAVELLRKSSKQGYAEAQNRLGHRYYYGRDIEADCEKAVYWYTKSAEQGCEAAISHLASHYENEKNYREAVIWYGKYAKLRLDWFHARLRASHN